MQSRRSLNLKIQVAMVVSMEVDTTILMKAVVRHRSIIFIRSLMLEWEGTKGTITARECMCTVPMGRQHQAEIITRRTRWIIIAQVTARGPTIMKSDMPSILKKHTDRSEIVIIILE